MFNITEYIKHLKIHFEDRDVVIRRTVISFAAIAVTSLAVFGIDTAVASLLKLM